MSLPYETGGSCTLGQAVAFHDVKPGHESMHYTCDLQHPPLHYQLLHLIKFSGDRIGTVFAVKDWQFIDRKDHAIRVGVIQPPYKKESGSFKGPADLIFVKAKDLSLIHI